MAALSTHEAVVAWTRPANPPAGYGATAQPVVVRRANEILNQQLLSDFEVEGADKSSVRASCRGSAGESYFVTLDVPPHDDVKCSCVPARLRDARARLRSLGESDEGPRRAS